MLGPFVYTQESDRRLLVLADFLEKLPEERFNYARWVGSSWAGKPDLSCGTTACALGWAGTIKEFNSLGLEIVSLGLDPDGSGRHHIGFKSHGKVVEPIRAAIELFGLNYEEAEFLFTPDSTLEMGAAEDGVFWTKVLEDGNGDEIRSPDSSANARQVARHIRLFVEHRDTIKVNQAVDGWR
jgi:hypothetical protein